MTEPGQLKHKESLLLKKNNRIWQTWEHTL